MGGRGGSSATAKSTSSNSPIGNEAPIKVESTVTLRSGRKETVLAVTANQTELTVDYSKPVSYEKHGRNKTVETHELKAGFYTETWSAHLRLSLIHI